jgi:hypothetical protein
MFLDLGTRRGWGVSVTPWLIFTPGKDPVPIVEEAGWAPGVVWTGAENLAPPGFDPRTVQPVVSRYTDWATQPTWPWKSMIYSECVSVACTALLYFSTLYNEWHNFLKKVSKNKICFYLLCNCSLKHSKRPTICTDLHCCFIPCTGSYMFRQ